MVLNVDGRRPVRARGAADLPIYGGRPRRRRRAPCRRRTRRGSGGASPTSRRQSTPCRGSIRTDALPRAGAATELEVVVAHIYNHRRAWTARSASTSRPRARRRRARRRRFRRGAPRRPRGRRRPRSTTSTFVNTSSSIFLALVWVRTVPSGHSPLSSPFFLFSRDVTAAPAAAGASDGLLRRAPRFLCRVERLDRPSCGSSPRTRRSRSPASRSRSDGESRLLCRREVPRSRSRRSSASAHGYEARLPGGGAPATRSARAARTSPTPRAPPPRR